MNKTAIIIPAYNEEKRIGNTLQNFTTFFGNQVKIIVVLNGCKDNTLEVVKEFPVEYLNYERAGKGFAIKEGLKYAIEQDYDLIGFTDADLSVTAKYFNNLILSIGEYDGIIANRWLPESITKRTLKRKILSKGFNILVRFLFNLPYTDTQCPAKLFKREAIKEIINDLQVNRWEFDIDLLYNIKKKKFKIEQIPVEWEDKAGSKIHLIKTPFQMFSGVLRLRLWYSPLRFLIKLYDKLPDKYKIYKL